MFKYINSIHKKVYHHLQNIPGWHTMRKIIVIESDDWGSIHMPSKEIYNNLIKEGLAVHNCPFCKYDSLATSSDLSSLFEVLTSYKDKLGNHAIITANTIVANPDFDKIASSGFTTYYYEPFTETLKRPPYDASAFDTWKEGMINRIFHPQFHGREHLNIEKWLTDLQNNVKSTRIGFENRLFGLTQTCAKDIKHHYLRAFDSPLEENINSYAERIKDGMRIFEQLFGYRSLSFIAPTYTWSPKLEPALKAEGIEYLQGLLTQRTPSNNIGKVSHTYKHFTGSKTSEGQIRLMRNVFFEPSLYGKTQIVEDCLRRICIAFNWRKPAIISSHRLNYIGSLDNKNRDNSLALLNNLLHRITLEWPDVEFMTSDTLGDLIRSSYEKK